MKLELESETGGLELGILIYIGIHDCQQELNTQMHHICFANSALSIKRVTTLFALLNEFIFQISK